jgi:hypothetical protein
MRPFHATIQQMLGRHEKLTDFTGKPIESVYS